MTSQIMNIVKFIPAIIGSVTLTVNAASFDCGKAGTNTEKQICASVQLNQLDEDLARKYKILMASIDDGQKNTLKKDQKSWLAQRNGCSNSACIEEAYSSRIKDLCQNTALSRLDECRASDPGLAGERGRDSSSGFEATSPQFQKLNTSANSENDREAGSTDENKSDERANRKDSNASLFGNASRSMGNPARSQSPKGEKATGRELIEVVIDGYGKDVPSAAQNAAQNALTQVVGSFIDAQKMVEKQVEIRDGVRSQVKNIKTDIKEYSQGSIKSFEITRVGEDNGLTVVTARAVIQVEELSKYFEDIVGGERQLDGTSLFAQSATRTQQNDDKVAILEDNVLKPLNSNLIEFDISSPKPFDLEVFKNEWKQLLKSGAPDLSSFFGRGGEIDKMALGFGNENLYIFDVTARLNENYIQGALKSLEAISREKIKIRNRIGSMVYADLIKGLKDDDFQVIMHDGKSSDIVTAYSKQSSSGLPRDMWKFQLDNFPFSAYVIGNARSRLKYLCGGSGNQRGTNPLIIQYYDESGNVLQDVIVNSEPFQAIALPADYTSFCFLDDYRTSLIFQTPAWQMYAKQCHGSEGIGIIKQRKFKLIVGIDSSIISKIKKVSLKTEE